MTNIFPNSMYLHRQEEREHKRAHDGGTARHTVDHKRCVCMWAITLACSAYSFVHTRGMSQSGT